MECVSKSSSQADLVCCFGVCICVSSSVFIDCGTALLSYLTAVASYIL